MERPAGAGAALPSDTLWRRVEAARALEVGSLRRAAFAIVLAIATLATIAYLLADARLGTAWAIAAAALIGAAGIFGLMVARRARGELASATSSAAGAGRRPMRAGAADDAGAALARWAARTRMRASERDHDDLTDASSASRAGRLRSALELSGRAPRDALVEALCAEAEADIWLLEREVAAAYRRRRAYWTAPAASLALALGLWALGAFGSTSNTRERRERPQVVQVGTLVGDLRLDVSAPSYARDALPDRHEFGDEATVLRGSTVRVSAAPLPGVRALQVELQRQGAAVERVTPVSEGGGRLAFAAVVDGPMSYRFVGVGHDGRPRREIGARALRDRPDAPPRCVLRAPAFEVEVRAGDAIVIDGEADDDLGLAGVDLVIARPGRGLERRAVAIGVGDRHVSVRESIEVDRLELQPGEVATVWIEARDLYDVDASHLASSERAALRMFSAERHHARLTDRLGELAIAWTFALADRLEGDPALAPTTLDAALAARERWASAESGLIELLAAARSELREDVLARPQAAADLDAMERRLRDGEADEERVIARVRVGAVGTAAARELGRVGRAHQVVVDAIERAVLGLAALAAAEHRGALARDGRALEALDKRLQAVLEALEKTPDDTNLRAEAERLIDAMSARIEQMANEAARQLALVPPEHLNEGALEPAALDHALDARKDALDAVRAALRGGRPADALSALAASRARLNAAMADLQAEVDAERTAADAGLERLLHELRRGIAEAREGQSALRERVRPTAEAQDRASAEHLRKGMELLVGQIQALLSDARDQIRPKRLNSQEMRGSRAIANARASLSQAAAAADGADVDGALMALIEAEEQLAAARGRLMRPLAEGERRDGIAARGLESDAARVGAAADRVARASAALRLALPRPEALHDSATRRRLGTLSSEQGRLERELGRVRARLAREASRHAGLDAQVGGRLDHAGQMMRQAASALALSDASAGQRRMAEALLALDAAERLMEPSGSPGAMQLAGDRGRSRTGFSPSSAPAPIGGGSTPDANEDFRKRLLEAAKRRAPEGWSERVRRYWRAVRQ